MFVIYTTQTCKYCDIAKQFLKLKKQEFTVIDITDNRELRDELHKKTGFLTVPIIQKGDRYIVGYDPKKIMELING